MGAAPSHPTSPQAARDAALEIVRALVHAGHTAYLAGGCVRDALLGLEPTDYDIATDATPDRVQSLFPRTALVGASFGVVLVRTNRATVEVATFRADGPYSDRRRPDSIAFSTPEGDAQRRDFTLNALFLDPLAEDRATIRGRVIHGRIIDFVGGRADLERGILRAVGDPEARLAEDHLRALRAVRFAARLGLQIEGETEHAIRAHAADLKGVSRERIGDECRRMLTHPERAVAAWTLQYLTLDAAILDHHTDAAPRLLGRLPADADYPTCLAAWAADRLAITDRSQIAGLVSHWRVALDLSNDERDALKATLEVWSRLEHEWGHLAMAPQKRLAASPRFVPALALVAARSAEEMVRIRKRVDELVATPTGLAPEPWVTGDALIASGVAPGPAFKPILDAAYDAQLDGSAPTPEAAHALALHLASHPPSPRPAPPAASPRRDTPPRGD